MKQNVTLRNFARGTRVVLKANAEGQVTYRQLMEAMDKLAPGHQTAAEAFGFGDDYTCQVGAKVRTLYGKESKRSTVRVTLP